MNPFIYPKFRHRRKLNPVFSSYSHYKPFLKEEFASQCVYCRLPDGLKGEDSFGVDHYHPKSIPPPELATSYSNLFYACNCCNRRKGAFWPTNDQLRAAQFIPNPCDHIMFDHLRYRHAHVEARSPTGEFAEKLLMLNDKPSEEYRELVFRIIAGFVEKRGKLQKTVKEIGRLSVSSPERAEELNEVRTSAESALLELEQDLAKIVGSSGGG